MRTSHTDAVWAEMHVERSSCNSLLDETAKALNDNTVVLMFLAVQKNKLELSVKTALRR